jgi:hypothetical protein
MDVLKQLGFISPGRAYVQNPHRGHFEPGANLREPAADAFTELALVI